MKCFLAILAGLVAGCATPIKQSSPIVQVITPDVLERHHTPFEAETPRASRWLREQDGALRMSYGHCSVRVARGGQILPASRIEEDRNALASSEAEFLESLESRRSTMPPEEYEDAKTGYAWWSAIMAGDEATRYPEIGARALYVGVWDGDTMTFTTSDGRYDVEIVCIFGGDGLTSVLDLARDISEAYDMRTGSRTRRCTE